MSNMVSQGDQEKSGASITVCFPIIIDFLSSTVLADNIIMSLHPATLTLLYQEEHFSRK